LPKGKGRARAYSSADLKLFIRPKEWSPANLLLASGLGLWSSLKPAGFVPSGNMDDW